MSCLSATLTNAVFAYLCICVFVFVYLQVRHPGTLFLRSLYHHLSENIWFVWSKTSYSGDKRTQLLVEGFLTRGVQTCVDTKFTMHCKCEF